ncbi:uncharacterized protein LOC111312607 isoform X2 [Durio zibethinus]|uniref:Uncharacterized protein LOC111312607 isoform X2 n=1 Tax=Durio zibethinus TaxID=66656 RepID=A0A6P6AV41_DURZI|nr:uncharacterized protein LOC111312607 isoform X2 [Durio zibethinus]
MEGFGRIESRTSSEASAAELTCERSPGFAHQEQIPSLDSLVTESTSTEWTDEKHSLYLKSMEASFVNQLYDSMNFLGWNSRKKKLPGSTSSRHTHCTASGQFKVLRGGCWKKINFERPGFQLSKTDDSNCFVASPWIQHFRSGSRSRVLASLSLQDSASSEEVSDQNFVDEEQGEKTSSECSSKKLKTLATDASCNDQVVP